MALPSGKDIFEDIENEDITDFMHEFREVRLSITTTQNEKRRLEEEMVWIDRQLRLSRENEDALRKELKDVRKALLEVSGHTPYWAKLGEKANTLAEEATSLKHKLSELEEELGKVSAELDAERKSTESSNEKAKQELVKIYETKLETQQLLSENQIHGLKQRIKSLEQEKSMLKDAIKRETATLRLEYEEKIAQLRVQLQACRKGDNQNLSQSVEFLKKRIQTRESAFALEKQQMMTRMAELEQRHNSKHRGPEVDQFGECFEGGSNAATTSSVPIDQGKNLNGSKQRADQKEMPASEIVKPVNRKRKLFPAYTPGLSYL